MRPQFEIHESINGAGFLHQTWPSAPSATYAAQACLYSVPDECSSGEDLFVFNVERGKLSGKIPINPTSVAFSPDGSLPVIA